SWSRGGDPGISIKRHLAGCAPWRSFRWITRRSTMSTAGDVFVAFPVRLERGVTADGIKLALRIVDPPAVEGQRHDVVLPVDLSDLVRNRLWIGCRPDRHKGSVISLAALLHIGGEPAIGPLVENAVTDDQ